MARRTPFWLCWHMAKFRGGRERAPQAFRSGAGPVGLSDVVTLLMLAGGVAVAAGAESLG